MIIELIVCHNSCFYSVGNDLYSQLQNQTPNWSHIFFQILSIKGSSYRRFINLSSDNLLVDERKSLETIIFQSNRLRSFFTTCHQCLVWIIIDLSNRSMIIHMTYI